MRFDFASDNIYIINPKPGTNKDPINYNTKKINASKPKEDDEDEFI